MATTGEVFPTAAETVAEAPWSDNTWLTPGNLTANDGAVAEITAATYDAGDQSFVLKGYTFDFSVIPDGSTINGVTARIEARWAAGSAAIDLLQLLDVSRAKVGTNKAATPIALTSTLTVYTQGGAADLWGNTLTDTWVKDPDFGIAIGMVANSANTDVEADYVTLEIDYTAPAAPDVYPRPLRRVASPAAVRAAVH